MAKDNKVPEISIDEALELYISIAFPQGLPEGEQGQEILRVLKKKIAQDRPEWAKASGLADEEALVDDDPRNYAEIKKKAIEEARKEDLPEDSEERYLYLRRQEAIENSQRRKEEQRESQKEESIRKKVIKKKNTDDQELHRRASLIKKVLLEKARQKMAPQLESKKIKPQFSEERDDKTGKARKPFYHAQIAFSETITPGTDTPNGPKVETLDHDSISHDPEPIKEKPDAKEWFRDFKSLSMEDRVESIKAYNLKKREMMDTKQDLVWDRTSSKKHEDGLSMEVDEFSFDQGMSLDSNSSSTY